MTCRKGEITHDDLKPNGPITWHSRPKRYGGPHEQRGDILRGRRSIVLSASPLTYFLRRNESDFVVFCLAKPEDAEAFAKRFDGELFRAGR
jgi:hypothetical protein